MIGCSQRSLKTEWKWYSNQRLKALKVRSVGHAVGTRNHPSSCSSISPCSDFVDAGGPLLRCRTREAGRLLVRPSDRSELDAYSLDRPHAANPRMAGPVSRLLLIG